jgi:hypothetical protein
MRSHAIILLAAILLGGAAKADELCNDPGEASASQQADISDKFARLADEARGWLRKEALGKCDTALGNRRELFDATLNYDLRVVSEQPEICGAGTRRRVDAANDARKRELLIWADAPELADEWQWKLLGVHEITGLAGRADDWTSSLCWMLPSVVPGLEDSRAAIKQLAGGGSSSTHGKSKEPVTVVAGGGSGGVHGGDEASAIKPRAIRALLESPVRYAGCGIDLETAFQAWIFLPIVTTGAETVPYQIEWKDGNATLVGGGYESPANALNERDFLRLTFELTHPGEAFEHSCGRR